MALYRAQIGFQVDTQLPRDNMVITPHYTGTDPAGLGAAIVANLKANTLIGTKPFTLNVYLAGTAPPHTPLYTGGQTGTTTVSNVPREVAICLSYFSDFNRPTYRGRLYIPAQFLGVGGIGAKPNNTQMVNAGTFAATLGKNLPAGHTWVLYSRKTGQPRAVSDWWVDDEWDTVRSRGLRSTTRVTGKV